MTIKRAILALGLIAALGSISSVANAATTCTPVDNSSSEWPKGNFTQVCTTTGTGSGVTPQWGQQMTDTLQTIADSQTDAAARLKGFVVTQGDVVRIRIKNDNILDQDGNNKVTVKYKVRKNDHLSDIARGLADAINNDPDLQAAGFSASASGTQVYITGPATGDTKYTGLLSAGATETISITNAGVATLGGTTEHPFGNFYMFHQPSDYNPFDTPPGSTPMLSNSFGQTVFGDGFSLIAEQWDSGKQHKNTPNVTAHELGHWLDHIYAVEGVLKTNDARIFVNGAPQAFDSISITVTNTKLPGDSVTVTYTASAVPTLQEVAEGLATAINNNGSLGSIGITASAADHNGAAWDVWIRNDAKKVTDYSVNIVNSVGTHAAVIDANEAHTSALFRAALATDWQIINGQPPCSYYADPPTNYGNGLFSFRKDPNGNYFCDTNFDPNINNPGQPGNGTSLQGYSGSNREVIETAWPGFFLSNNLNDPRLEDAEAAEVFSELVAIWFNFTDYRYKGPDAGTESSEYVDRNFQIVDSVYHNNQFTCTRDLVFNLIFFGEAKITPGAGAFIGESGHETFIACPAS
ncbi:MAG: hypothetical protein IT343_24005 [Candidatus Melainabacteria bacterium]|jgi:hypothetical protein|nr:hypothetical protein [Candidatus Melainabacteria bacterium]